MSDPYWTLDTSLFDGTFRYFGSNPVQVRGKIHTQQERYRKSDVNQEITPIRVEQGTRTYLHMKPFVLVPDIILTIGLFSEQREDQAIGEVLAAQERKQREIEIGQAQAWYYPDNTIVLWECFFHDFVRDQPLRADPNMKALWTSFEQFLAGQFPEADRIVTTSHDPLFDTDEYQAFLASLGYERVAKAAYGKAIDRSNQS